LENGLAECQASATSGVIRTKVIGFSTMLAFAYENQKERKKH
jgi:hypothetical protein